MQGTIALTDYGWFERLRSEPKLEEVNFWKPSATRTFNAERFSPFLFKLRAREGGAVCGFGFFGRYSRFPDWFAWETFGTANGCSSLGEMRAQIAVIRKRIHYRGSRPSEIGCILILQPVFLPRELWVDPPRDWPERTQVDKRYDLHVGEGARVWSDCLAAASLVSVRLPDVSDAPRESRLRFGRPAVVTPRLGQGTFRVAVTDAYGRACAVTSEHSLPALEAAHIKPYACEGPHDIANGLLLRADLHRLFDQGYITVTPELRLEVSRRLREDFSNGRSYYPLHGLRIRCPEAEGDRPGRGYLQWHCENVYVG